MEINIDPKTWPQAFCILPAVDGDFLFHVEFGFLGGARHQGVVRGGPLGHEFLSTEGVHLSNLVSCQFL